MKCVKCYREIGDKMKFCNYCGAKQPFNRKNYENAHPELADARSDEENKLGVKLNIPIIEPIIEPEVQPEPLEEAKLGTPEQPLQEAQLDTPKQPLVEAQLEPVQETQPEPVVEAQIDEPNVPLQEAQPEPLVDIQPEEPQQPLEEAQLDEPEPLEEAQLGPIEEPQQEPVVEIQPEEPQQPLEEAQLDEPDMPLEVTETEPLEEAPLEPIEEPQLEPVQETLHDEPKEPQREMQAEDYARAVRIAELEDSNATLEQENADLEAQMLKYKQASGKFKLFSIVAAVVALLGLGLGAFSLFNKGNESQDSTAESAGHEFPEFTYYGELVNGEPNGYGLAVFKPGDPDKRKFYVGKFEAGKRVDDNAMLLYNDGRFFYGKINDELLEKGILYFQTENNHFEGTFDKDPSDQNEIIPYTGTWYKHEVFVTIKNGK